MTISLEQAICFDIETLPNVFTLTAQGLHSDLDITFEVSEYKDERDLLMQWLVYWQSNNVPLIGFNNINFDYPVIHRVFQACGNSSVSDIYEHAMDIIESQSRFGHQVWQNERFAPQIDLYKIHHFDNKAKATSLKALQISMRLDSVMEMPLPFNQAMTREQIREVLIPYNKHDVRATKQFAHISMEAIKFRIGLMDTLRGDVLNFNDSKIGSKILEQRLGDEICFDTSNGFRQMRQSPRDKIPLADIIFPYVHFTHPEFRRILDWIRKQTLSADDLKGKDVEFSLQTDNGWTKPTLIRTKGVFTGLKAHVGNLDFYFGTGGIHGSVESQKVVADDEYCIIDIDVAALYPSIAIVNRLHPEHLGERFVEEYAKLPLERKKYKKGTVENAAFKLASNGTYGNSNNQYSVFYDPKFTMSITINGQLMLCMLAERLLAVPTLQIIQINTDGITYRVHRNCVEQARAIQKRWEAFTKLVLEEAHYSRMWIRDVNNYVAENTEGKLKMKGAYWYPVNFPDDISHSSPPAWHKDFSAIVSTKAAVEHMVKGTPIDRFIYGHTDPFEFMCRVKVDRSSKLYIDDAETQRITRYYIATNGGNMRKVSPPVKGARVGDYKRKNGISDYEYHSILETLPEGTHDERIHTKNKSRYEIRETSVEAGYKIAECNDARRFDFGNVNYQWYIDKAQKLVIE